MVSHFFYIVLTKKNKKNLIRQDIVDSATIYSKNLAGKTFLYVYGNEYFEVSFPSDGFLHLTGVETNLTAKNFYVNAKNRKLTTSQFYFTKNHDYRTAKKKLPCLKRLPELTNTMVCILKDVKTITIIYKLSITNLEFTLGLTKDAKNHYFVPRTLRVKDKSIENAKGGEVVDFIFSKDASITKYNTLLVKDEHKKVPECIYNFLDEKSLNTL